MKKYITGDLLHYRIYYSSFMYFYNYINDY